MNKRKKNIHWIYCFFRKKLIFSLKKYKYRINEIKYCTKINNPAILIDNKYAVANEKIITLILDIFLFFISLSIKSKFN